MSIPSGAQAPLFWPGVDGPGLQELPSAALDDPWGSAHPHIPVPAHALSPAPAPDAAAPFSPATATPPAPNPFPQGPAAQTLPPAPPVQASVSTSLIGPQGAGRPLYQASPIPVRPITERDAHLAPIAVLTGTRRQPSISFVAFPGADQKASQMIARLGRTARTDSMTLYHHPIHGSIRGSIRATSVPPELLRLCIIDTWTAAAATDLAGITDLASLLHPMVCADPSDPSQVTIWPRLGDHEKLTKRLPPGASWVRGAGYWTAPLDGVLDREGQPRPGFILEDVSILERARQRRASGAFDPERALLIGSVGNALTIEDVQAGYDRIAAEIGDLPEWFGMNPYGYQRTAALAMAASHGLLADEPGTGKSVMGLAASAILAPERILIASPGVGVTHWVRETRRTNLPEHMGEGADVVRIISGRKQPPIPLRGVVVVTPSLLRSRPQLFEELKAWQPQVLIYDEAHGAKTWESKTSVTMRDLARSVRDAGGRAFALTGTPLSQSPAEAASLLDIVGCLDSVFGGYTAFMETFCRRDNFGKWVPRKSETERLARMLNDYCWIRRTKAQVQKDMPPKVRSALIVDVDPKGIVEAHRATDEKVDALLDAFARKNNGRIPEGDELEKLARANISLVSNLREAAGIAKVPAACDELIQWAESTERSDDGTWDRPLIAWVHHHSVMDAMLKALAAKRVSVGVIRGGDGPDTIGETAQAFQDGRWPIMLCAIRAAGVAVTLTRSSDELFIETDWDNSIVSQAESRAHRNGQTRPVLIRTMIAPGTVDLHMQAVLRKKAELLLEITPSADVDVAVIGEDEDIEGNTPEISRIKDLQGVVMALIQERIAMRARRRR
ncbi:DEAD/DEAH box helicase [Brachybacterium sp. JHP9]|uniref:DEAD/DEAH box helicase n=1 Tax=Brachybacterium equifaecis TaxID=2910770 RepID=A0ABT0R1D0_9MICO|nr:DEAD/DEAH box helicase [Brachybacterium equifaecis]MCL6423701.1 DEAD/DEAH box helicase [Brachybacterium equifaecis]